MKHDDKPAIDRITWWVLGIGGCTGLIMIMALAFFGALT